jgi:chaperone modulatory protein CbpM
MMPGVQCSDSERRILKKWIKPDEGCGEYEFCEIDVTRARLIRDLRDDIEVNGATLPAVLSLIDHHHDLRRRTYGVSETIDKTVSVAMLRRYALERLGYLERNRSGNAP